MFLPLDAAWSVSNSNTISENSTKLTAKKNGSNEVRNANNQSVIVTIATVMLKAQIFWIYMDAGLGKYNDPLKGWSLHADPIPALDSYTRHTVPARYLYGILGPVGLRLLTPSVVYVELLVAPVALIGSFLGNKKIVYAAIAMICSLHIGIAITVRNTVLLSSVANCAWCIFLPPGCFGGRSSTHGSEGVACLKPNTWFKTILSILLIIPFIAGSIWFETVSGQCNQSMKHIWSTLLHNRWNVFVGAEE